MQVLLPSVFQAVLGLAAAACASDLPADGRVVCDHIGCDHIATGSGAPSTCGTCACAPTPLGTLHKRPGREQGCLQAMVYALSLSRYLMQTDLTQLTDMLR